MEALRTVIELLSNPERYKGYQRLALELHPVHLPFHLGRAKDSTKLDSELLEQS